MTGCGQNNLDQKKSAYLRYVRPPSQLAPSRELFQYNLGMTVAVIGAGASGMAAALQAAWHGAAVTLFERNAAVGRKLLVTGSGRCNITNDAVARRKIRLRRPGLDGNPARPALAWATCWPCSPRSASRFIKHRTAGITPSPIRRTSVVEAFASALNLAGVTLCQSNPGDLDPRSVQTGLLSVTSATARKQEQEFERVIVSAGGKAYPSLGSRGELFPVLEQPGAYRSAQTPGAGAAAGRPGQFESHCRACAWTWASRCGRVPSAWRSPPGNLIFTEWGLNGPAVMDLSHHVSAQPGAGLELSLNLLAFFQDEFDHLLAQKRTSRHAAAGVSGRLFPAQSWPNLSSKTPAWPKSSPWARWMTRALERLVDQLKDTRLAVKGVRDFEYCQVSAGGVPVSEVDPAHAGIAAGEGPVPDR